MFMTSLIRCKFTSWLLLPIIAGLLFSTIPVTRALAAPAYPIRTPDDARSWGLDSLGTLMRSHQSDYPVQPLILNPSFKVPLPANLGNFVKNRQAALVLGKALFWDMQVGSDGIQACATCHFQAGADVRSKNQVATQGNQVKYERDGDIIGFFNAPKTGTDTFEEIDGRLWEPNFQLAGVDFPLVLTQNAFLPESPAFGDTVAADTGKKNRNDVVGSMGLMTAKFTGVTPGSPVDNYDTEIGLGVNRQTTGRNAPPSVNAVFNLLQFWDGRADTRFNGFNPIGRHDTSSPKYFVNVNGKLKERILNMKVASLASQSVGPPLSDVEMSFAGRTWPDVGKKLTRDGLMKPLAYQEVSTSDSVLGPYSNSPNLGLKNGNGLDASSYKALVQAAFKDELWNIGNQVLRFPQARLEKTTVDELIYIQGPYKIVRQSRASKTLPAGYTQMEANFSLFWGIAVMLYEAELVSEQSRFDKWMEGTGTLTEAELDGLNVFVNQGKCIACHSGPEFTNATVRNTKNGKEQIEPIRKTNGDPAFYDNGFYNVGMTPTVDDIQRGDKDPNGKPWGNARQFLFQYNGIMDIPFEIIGLPITNLQARNPVDTNDDGVNDQQELWKELFDLVTGAKTDEFLVCIDLDMSNGCDLNDDIRIETLDQDGNCKASTVRNVELNGPYFHNGGAATLQQILDNYDIGGKFRKEILNKVDMLPDIERLGLADASTPNGTNAEEALVAFILALTDHRVKTEKAPFDHPQLFIPIDGTAPILDVAGGPAAWNAWLVSQVTAGKFEEDRATGVGGLPALGLPDLQPFLNLDPFAGDTGKGSIVEVGSE